MATDSYAALRQCAEDAAGNMRAHLHATSGNKITITRGEAEVLALYCETVLALPRRNCDVGTADEQDKRWKTNCGHGIPNCKHCKVYEQAKNSGLVNGRYLMRCDCRFIWSQMPYEDEQPSV